MTPLTLRHLFVFSIIACAFTCARATISTSIAAELLKQLRKDVPDVRDCEPEHGPPFTAEEIHLAVDGSLQYLLTSTGACMCGQVNCSEWVYRRGPKKWELILETQGYLFTTRAAIHHGYRDVETRSRDNAARVDILAYSFDGQVYRAAPARQGAVQSDATRRTHRVQFAPGTSSIQLQGSVSPDDAESWNISARKAQALRLSLADHENSGIRFKVFGPSGFSGQPLRISASRWEVTLIESGTYRIVVDSPHKRLAKYTLSVEIR